MSNLRHEEMAIFLETYDPSVSYPEGEVYDTDRTSDLYILQNDRFVKVSDKSTLPILDYVYENTPDEVPNIEFSSIGNEICKVKDLGTLYHILQTKWKGIKCYKRYKKYFLQLRYCYPAGTSDQLKEIIEDCARVGAIATIPFIPAIPAMLSAFSAAFLGCIEGKVDEKVSYRISKQSYYTRWKRC